VEEVDLASMLCVRRSRSLHTSRRHGGKLCLLSWRGGGARILGQTICTCTWVRGGRKCLDVTDGVALGILYELGARESDVYYHTSTQ